MGVTGVPYDEAGYDFGTTMPTAELCVFISIQRQAMRTRQVGR
jgi:hypothetical protein